MLRKTFQIIPRVGPARERSLWEAGIGDWEDFRSSPRVPGFGAERKERADSLLSEAEDMLEGCRWREISSLLPRREQWRLYPEARKDAVYLDIETDGLGHDSIVTVVGLHRNGRTDALVRGEGLDVASLRELLEGASMLVTFNGSCFDLPVLRQSFPSLDWELPHLDLRFACQRVGLSGGLLRVERALGLSRDDSLEDIDGFEAVRLWDRWRRRGDRDALDLLTAYNRADTANLEPLAEIIYPRLVGSCLEC